MITHVNPISTEISNYFNRELSKYYSFKEGDNVDSIISEILNDENLNLFLFSFLPRNNGLKLGQTCYFNDIMIDIHYGLTVNFDKNPRKAGLFVVESFGSYNDSYFKQLENGFKVKQFCQNGFPNYQNKLDFMGWPSSAQLLEELNYVFVDMGVSGELERLLIPLKF